MTLRDPCGTRGSDMLGWALTGDGSLNMGGGGGQGEDDQGQEDGRTLENAWMGPVSKGTVCGVLPWDFDWLGPRRAGLRYPPRGQTATRFVLFLENEANGTKAHSPKSASSARHPGTLKIFIKKSFVSLLEQVDSTQSLPNGPVLSVSSHLGC